MSKPPRDQNGIVRAKRTDTRRPGIWTCCVDHCAFRSRYGRGHQSRMIRKHVSSAHPSLDFEELVRARRKASGPGSNASTERLLRSELERVPLAKPAPVRGESSGRVLCAMIRCPTCSHTFRDRFHYAEHRKRSTRCAHVSSKQDR